MTGSFNNSSLRKAVDALVGVIGKQVVAVSANAADNSLSILSEDGTEYVLSIEWTEQLHATFVVRVEIPD